MYPERFGMIYSEIQGLQLYTISVEQYSHNKLNNTYNNIANKTYTLSQYFLCRKTLEVYMVLPLPLLSRNTYNLHHETCRS